MKKITITFLFIITFISTSIAQDMSKTLFGKIDNLMAEVEETDLKYLSPTYYEKAVDEYKQARAEYEDEANLKDIQVMLENVSKYINTAQSKAKVSQITLKSSLAARKDAVKVEADKHASELWENAEEQFRKAGVEVENGDMGDAEEASKEAEELFREAELKSIKILYLDETRGLISSAKEQDVETYSPQTLIKATDLVKEAEEKLSSNRYDTDLPRNLAQQAKYEVNHAIYLTDFIKKFEETEMTKEELLLSYEKPLQKISSHFDYDAKFDKDMEIIANNIVQKIVDLKNNYHEASQDNIDLKQEIKILKEELGGLSKEKSVLDEKMKKLAEAKARYEKVNNSFNDEEAEIFKEGNNIFIRLVGLTFPVGKSIIESENFTLLAKVQNALKQYPQSSIVIEGHTDSYGSDEKNLELSQERASAVKQYILANMQIDVKKIMSFGFGETKPIANNETKEGRAKNRRIDLIIQNAD